MCAKGEGMCTVSGVGGSRLECGPLTHVPLAPPQQRVLHVLLGAAAAAPRGTVEEAKRIARPRHLATRQRRHDRYLAAVLVANAVLRREHSHELAFDPAQVLFASHARLHHVRPRDALLHKVLERGGWEAVVDDLDLARLDLARRGGRPRSVGPWNLSLIHISEPTRRS
eukprot:2591091-Prymnesium_polylepis.4